MRIAMLMPGSGGKFYCENCLRDIALIRALRRAGADIYSVPMYLPAMESFSGQVHTPLFFGGINVYLQQKSALFRKTPRWIDRLLDNRLLLSLAAGMDEMTDPQDLGDTTISMLAGSDGFQAKEIYRLIDWLNLPAHRPDLICLSNLLLSGLAPAVKEMLNLPVVCLAQDEDEFIETLPADVQQDIWPAINSNVSDIDQIISVSDYYSGRLVERYSLPVEKITTLRIGVEDFPATSVAAGADEFKIGFLSRLCPHKGLDTLYEAFKRLSLSQDAVKVRLRLCGGAKSSDRRFVAGLLDDAQKSGLRDLIVYSFLSA